VRGASALDQLLAEFKDAPVKVQVVWEPVLKTDFAAPLNRVLGLLHDPRVAQHWDPERILSADLVRAVNENPSRYDMEQPFPADFVVWDVVAVFGKDARWERDLPPPAYYGGPVVESIEGARKAIAAQLGRETPLDRISQ
jgi:hypothetical protein